MLQKHTKIHRAVRTNTPNSIVEYDLKLSTRVSMSGKMVVKLKFPLDIWGSWECLNRNTRLMTAELQQQPPPVSSTRVAPNFPVAMVSNEVSVNMEFPTDSQRICRSTTCFSPFR